MNGVKICISQRKLERNLNQSKTMTRKSRTDFIKNLSSAQAVCVVSLEMVQTE